MRWRRTSFGRTSRDRGQCEPNPHHPRLLGPVAAVTGALSIDVEVICSDTDRHRHRVTARTSDLDGLTVPTWEEVQSREFESWGSPVLRVDTALGAEPAAREIVAAINAGLREQGEVAAPTPQASESQAAEPSVG